MNAQDPKATQTAPLPTPTWSGALDMLLAGMFGLNFNTASLLENWIDEAEQRTWFLFEATRRSPPGSN